MVPIDYSKYPENWKTEINRESNREAEEDRKAAIDMATDIMSAKPGTKIRLNRKWTMTRIPGGLSVKKHGEDSYYVPLTELIAEANLEMLLMNFQPHYQVDDCPARKGEKGEVD